MTESALQADVLRGLLDPKNVESFRENLPGEINLLVFESPGQPGKAVQLHNMYPFMTIYDIKLALYVHLGSKEEAIPEFVFLGRTIPPGKRIVPVNYQWFVSSSPTETVSLLHPANLMKDTTPLDSRFVESNGERRILGITNLDRMTIEEVFLKTEGATIPTLHAYLYSAVEPLISGERPLSESSWNGRLYPYFPQLSLSKDVATAEQIADTRRFAKGFSRRRQFYGRLEEVLESGEPLLPINMTGVKFLRLQFLKPKEFPGIEAMFYEVPVNARRPYMRLLPADGNAISKIHMIKERPNIQDPRLLSQWSQERSPTPSRDFALAKILLRQASGNLSPLYFTIRLLDDGSADVTIEPPRGIRKLDPREDLDSLPEIFAQGIQGLPYLSEVPVLRNGMFIFGMNVTGSAAPFTQRGLRDRLPLFSSVFQEIPALPGEQPLLMLRYKLISNFVTEDRIQTYITQLISRKVAKGETDEVALPALVAEDFEITVEEARKRVIENMRSAGKIALVNAETKEYAVNENPGIDVAIFAQHPFYSFHMYRVDSISTLRRIITFLSILFSKTAAALQVEEEAVREVLAASAHLLEAEGPEPEEEEDAEFENVDEENIERAGKESEPVQQVTTEESDDESDGDYDMDALAAMGATLEEENTARNVHASIAETEEPPSMPVEEMRTKLVADRTAVREDVERAPTADASEAATAAPAATAQKRVPIWKRAAPTAPTAQPLALTQKKGLTDYFSSKLMEAEAPLFDYTKSHPSVTKYVSQCQANLMRQPAVLSQEKYEQMLKEYDDVINSDPPQIKIYEFPLDKDAKKEPYKPTGEYYTVMKYGISERRQNYYLCCKYWCVRDEILVREKELKGTTLRRPVKQADGSERTTKAPDTCPFCEGTVVKNRSYPGVNETIIERLGTDGGRQHHINFLKKTHPEGYSLPCCFKVDQPIRTSDKAFQTGTAKKVPTFVTEEEEEDTVEIDETGGIAPEDLIIYEDVLIKTKYTYIVGSEKFPLDAAVKKVQKVRLGNEAPRGPPKLALPQIGLLPPELDSYFSQVSKDLVVRTIKQTLKPSAEGFLRVGVENRKQFRNDSFLAAVAPFFGKSSARTMKQFLSDIIQPRIFMAMNYGNLAIEMYKPGLPRPKISERLKSWAKSSLRVKKITVTNKELVLRAYMSYSYFKTWLDSDDEVKEYRQFAHLFAQPGILQTGVRRITESGAVETEYRRPGLIFIVLDLLESGEVRTRCPPYPINKELFSKCDIGFLFHHYSGIWEPIFYADNRTIDERDIEAYFLIFSNIQRPKWPKIVEDRLREFSTQCASRTGGRGIYTSLAGVPSNTIIGATMMRQALESDESLEYYGLLRDSYNHISALIYKGEGLVAVPVVDDGLTVGNQDGILVMDWDDFEPATIEQTIGFYARHIEPRFPRLYGIRAAVVSRGSEKIEAVQLTNNLYIPVLAIVPDALPETVTLPVEEITEMEWTINRRIAIGVEGAQQVPGDEARLEMKQFTEVYEHLRLIFSNWLASLEDGGEFRDSLEYTINRPDLPLFEKRRLLEIMLGSTIESWLTGPGDETENAEHTPGLLRMDCRLRPQSECSGMCSWIQSKEKCLLHVPAKSPVPDTESAVRVLVLRLIEELIRFGGKRKEIFNQRVSQLALLENPIRMEDQYILPERSAKWAELLRLEWSLENPERPKFLEEMARAATAEEAAAAAAAASPANPSELPESLISFLGTDDPAIGNLQLYPSQTGNLAPFLSYLGTTADAIGLPPNATELTDESLTKLTRITKYPTVQIDLRTDTHIERQLTRDNKSGYAVFVIQDGRPPSLLVRNVEEPKILEMAELPEVLKAIFTASKKIFIMGKRV